jgi:hypothetical protein
MTTFISVVGSPQKSQALFAGVRDSSVAGVWTRSADDFRNIPRTPFCYWAPGSLTHSFATVAPIGTGGWAARVGLQSSDDFRWLRAWWEPGIGYRYCAYAKGGISSKYYADLPLVVDWALNGELLEISKKERLRRGEITANNSKNWNAEFYLKPGLTWPSRTSSLTLRALPALSVIGNKGPGLFAPTSEAPQLLAVLATSASKVFEALMGLQVSRLELANNFDAGLLATVPVPVKGTHDPELSSLGRSGWSLVRDLDTVNEVSHAFVVPAVMQVVGGTFSDRVSAWAARVAAAESELERVQSEIDELCFELYEISDEDRRAITGGFGLDDNGDASDADSSDDDGEPEADVALDEVGLAAGLVSWAVGVAVGRFDVRLATGEREWPTEPDPFDPLPVCSPGMLAGDDGLPLLLPPDGYPIEPSPVLVEDPGYELDLTGRVRSVFDVVVGDDADLWWSDVGAVLDARNGVEGWLRRGFFDHHLKTYSKSRRKAPIMWPVGTRSGSFRVWLYAHQVTGDTLFRVMTDIVEPKLAAEQQRLSDSTQEFGPSPTASQRRTLEQQQSLVDELIELQDELRAIAPLWAPDLNDGIVIVLAPLWRLFAHHRAWSKELRERWKQLAAGDYDWAQLAMHIWPERVIPKCADDRSLAIAHDLEDTFWVQADDNPDKWHPRQNPTTPIDQLIAQRTNPATTTARTHPNP